MKNLRIEAVESVTARVSNAADENRKAEIAANVTYGRDNVQSVSNGEVKEDDESYPVASFDQYGDDNLNIRWNHKGRNLSRTEVLDLVEGFIAQVCEQNPTESIISPQLQPEQ